ncbi:MAG: hypothetical protein H0X43_00145 [Nitrosospira sp.]|nr:hypothetical protein [Nitrosospira sp.]
MLIKYNCLQWAPLAWVARCSINEKAVSVWHGRQVETRDEWFCEAAWPGTFSTGGFDQTDLMAGTGGHCRDNVLTFVAPGNTVDRILSLRTAEGLLVSNSLSCLLAVSGAAIDPTFPRYYEDFTTIIHGLSAYKRTLATSLGDIRITMFGLLTWDGREATERTHEIVRRDFSSFTRYERFLQDNLTALAQNIADPARRQRYRLLATASSGYDSPAISVLARKAGCEEALCIDKDRFGEMENGDRVAAHLGLRPIHVAREAWRKLDDAELSFIAADGTAEAVSLASAGANLAGSVLLTGYHGDKVWAKYAKDLSEDVVRGDSSGLSLTEYRLWAGFIHCPITFWGIRQIRDINRLSNSKEMLPWDIPGDYSRPIPRRIVESAGVPREAFGMVKRASAVAFTEFLSPSSLETYRAWLTQNRSEWLKRGKLPPPTNEGYERLASGILAMIESALHKIPLLWRLAPQNSLDRPSRLRRYAFAWAAGAVSRRYLRQIDDRAGLPPDF